MQQTLIDGRYAPRDLLGGGGMAKVYLAHDELLGRDVALKVMREQYAEDEEFVERFRREAQSAASLSHPNIVQIYDRGCSEDSRYYIVMEYVPGGTLKERVEGNGPLGSATAAGWAAQIAGALGVAHKRGVVHRDVKPQNVLITENGDAKVADFGIARAASATSISRSSLILGTAAYMSPEQALGEAATSRSDLYSLGVVLYEMMTGRVPFTAESPVAISIKHVNEPPRPPKELNPEIPEGMNALVMKLLSKNPADRHASAAELTEDLQRVATGVASAAAGADVATPEEAKPAPGSEPTLPLPVRGVKPRRRKVPLVLASLALLLTLLGGAGWYLWQSSEGPGIAGSLEGVPGGAREALEDARRAIGSIGEPQDVEVPGVVGLTEEAAKERLAEAGFESEPRPRESSRKDVGKVLEQSVAGGKEAEKGSTILLAVGAGRQEVQAPQLSGFSLDEVKKELAESELNLGDVDYFPSDTVPEGEIVEQDPRAGTEVDPGTTVDLTVSSGPPQGASGEDGASGGEGPAGATDIQAPILYTPPAQPAPAVEQPAPAPPSYEEPSYEEPPAPEPAPVAEQPAPAPEPAPVQPAPPAEQPAPAPAPPSYEEPPRDDGNGWSDGRGGDYYGRGQYDGGGDGYDRGGDY